MNKGLGSLNTRLNRESDTIRFGEDLALALKPGDCVALRGDLGAGKSTLARALIRAVADDSHLEVPSPTFTLVQTYELRLRISHFDLYRLGDVSELDELGLDEALDQGVALIEWPERAGQALPRDTIEVSLSSEGDGRRATVSGPAVKIERIERALSIREFLDREGFTDAERRFLTGDASSRAYEKIKVPGRSPMVLMDAPRQSGSPPLRDGKSYPQIVHLAQDVYPFVAIDCMLREKGLAAPEIYASDCERGLLLLEHLGSGSVLDENGTPIAERYQASVECLAHMHGMTFPREIVLPGGHLHRIPDYDRAAMKMEAELLLDWHFPWKRNGRAASEQERREYVAIWDHLIDELDHCERTLVLRDFHSPNIIWRPEETGIGRIGLIDFQDAMIGPSSYDLVSIVQDARVTVERPLADSLMRHYLMLRRGHSGFDEETFLKSWHIMAAQRACKLNGLWVRLMQRDSKPAYMRNMPRTLWHLSVAFEHPVLAPLREWCAKAGIDPSESTR